MTSPTPMQQGHGRHTGAHNIARYEGRNLGRATGLLSHWAHYYDNAPSLKEHATSRYLAACEAFGVWG